LLNEELDFAYNNNPPSFPEGLDTEVFTFNALEQAYLNAKDAFEQEHVTQFFYRNPTLFKNKNYTYPQNKSYLRWTIDTVKDYEMATEVYNHLYKEGTIFLMNDIFELLKKYPAIAEINSDVKRSAMYS
jgi:spore coat polysaccharide biosynthesis protein SpsF